MIYVIIASDVDMRELADMIMKTHKLIWNILFSKQKSGAAGVFRDLGPLVP